MSLLHRTYSGTRRAPMMPLSRSTTDLAPSRPVSRLIILQARFQQKQLREKEEKLLKLYEEQQERAMQRVGTRVQSGGSGGSSLSSTSSVGAGKVRNLFQARRGTSEPRGTVPAGRDRSRPLQPLQRHAPSRTQSFNQGTRPSRTRNQHASDFHLNVDPDEAFQRYLRDLDDLDPVRDNRFRRQPKPNKSTVLYFGGSHNDLHFSDELDFGQSFHVIDDQKLHDILPRRKQEGDDDYFVTSFNNKRQFYENKFSGVSDNALNQTGLFQKLPNVGLNNSFTMNQKTETTMPGKYKTYVSGNTKKYNMIQNEVTTKTNLPLRQTQTRTGMAARENGENKRKTNDQQDLSSAGDRSITPVTPISKPARAIVRKQTPIPAPAPPSLQREMRKTQPQTIAEAAPEVTPPIPASRTTVPRPTSAAVTSPKMAQPRPTVPSVKRTGPKPTSDGLARLLPQQDLVSCKTCGRGFASDRVGKHQTICQKSNTAKRKVFDTVKQRVRGTEAEKYVRNKSASSQKKPTSASSGKNLQTNWRKKHEDFINSIRAAKEVQVHLKRGGKLSDLPPPPPSDYSDYVQCPHCSRRFNETAASRHIPKCATMLHNKPNPNAQRKTTQSQSPSAAIRGRK